MKRLEGSLRFQRGCLLPKYHQAVDVGSPPQGGLIMCPCCLKNYICHTSIWAKCVAVVWLLSRFLLWDTMTAACQASLSFTISQSLLKFMSIESVVTSNHLTLCRPLLLLPSIFPIIRVFFSESALRLRGPKYWSFSFNISPFSEYLEFISFKIDWFDLAVQGTLKSLPQHHSSKASIFQHSSLFNGLTLTSIHDYWENHTF